MHRSRIYCLNIDLWAFEGVTILATTTLSTVFKDFRAYSLSVFLFIGIVGGVLVIALPFDDRIGLLLSYWVARGLFKAFTRKLCRC